MAAFAVRVRRGLAAVLLAALLLPLAAQAAGARHVAVVLDTSTSMREADNDRPRLAIQAIKILADLLGPEDALTLTWMPADTACSSIADLARRIDRQASDPEGFKRALDARATYGGPTNFIVPLVTARQALEGSQGKERLLIVVSDAGRDSCRAQSVEVLRALRAAGVHTAAVSLGNNGRLPHNQYDIATTATNPSELLSAIGEIYQRFLGAKAPASGTLAPGSSRIAVEVAPFVAEAFLLVAAEGPVGALAAEKGHPGAESVEPGFGSGETRGLDGLARGYRILRLRRPQPGSWGFSVAGLAGPAGWYLIQDFSLAMRVETPPRVAQGEDVAVTLELLDERTGKRVQRPAAIPGLEVYALIGGNRFAFRDDGQEGDASADDGLMTARVRFARPGPATFPVRLASRYLQDEREQRTEVTAAAWGLAVLTPPRGFVGEPVKVAVALKSVGGQSALRPPAQVLARLADGRTLALGDDGRDGDAAAGDRVYSRDWTAQQPGELDIRYTAEGGGQPAEASARLAIGGTLAFGTPGTLELGRLGSRSQRDAELDLGFVQARGTFPLQLKSGFSCRRSTLEIDLGQGFAALDDDGLKLDFQGGGRTRFPARLRVGRCPQGVEPAAAGTVAVEAQDQHGRPLRAEIPIRVQIVPDTWLACWWPVIAAVLLALLAIFILYGILSPARFPRNLAVVLSPEANMDEGYPFHIRSQRGSGSGFYRDARIHITTDFQLKRSASGALARLRADRMGVFIEPLPGNTVLALDADNRWEPLEPDRETRIRFSTLYKNAAETLFFELRNM